MRMFRSAGGDRRSIQREVASSLRIPGRRTLVGAGACWLFLVGTHVGLTGPTAVEEVRGRSRLACVYRNTRAKRTEPAAGIEDCDDVARDRARATVWRLIARTVSVMAAPFAIGFLVAEGRRLITARSRSLSG